MAEASLIPKKIVEPRREIGGGVHVFFRISLVFFLISVLSNGGLFFYERFLEDSLTKQEQALKQLESQFPLKDIEQREELASAISTAKKLLDTHVYQSRLFAFLEQNALPDVGLTNFSYTEKDHKISANGEAGSYQLVAEQTSLYEHNEHVASASFSNLSLTPKGTVNFNLTIILKGPLSL